MKKILIILMGVTLLNNACTKDPGKEALVSTYMDISYLDKSGNDLLNPKTPGYYSVSNIHVYKMVNGVKTEVNNALMDSPHDFQIYKNDSLNRYYLLLYLDNPTYLQLNQNIIDTITCDIEKSNGNTLLKKLWYNRKLCWVDTLGFHLITITK
jgi:hypothetical protein